VNAACHGHVLLLSRWLLGWLVVVVLACWRGGVPLTALELPAQCRTAPTPSAQASDAAHLIPSVTLRYLVGMVTHGQRPD
jgi:hypothetical protein